MGAGPQNGTDRAANEYWQGRGPVPAGPQNGNRRAEHEYWPVGNSATPGTGLAALYRACGRAGSRKKRRNPFPLALSRQRGGEGIGQAARDELCETLLSAWEPALGDSPRRGYDADPSGWLDGRRRAARRATPGRGYSTRWTTWSATRSSAPRALTMPGFAKVADQLIARDHARQQRVSASGPRAAGGGLGWAEARGAARASACSATAATTAPPRSASSRRAASCWCGSSSGSGGARCASSRCATASAATPSYGPSSSTTPRTHAKEAAA